MKIYFITYGNDKFKYSVKRIVIEAQKIDFFDEVLDFCEDDLPIYIKSSPLFSSSKGGGYWLWKPYVVKKVLEKIQDNDIVIYSDAGNKIFKSTKWEDYIKFLDKYDSLFFQYKEDFDYGWSKFNSIYNDSPKLKYWVKKSAVDHFSNLFVNDMQWLEKTKLMAGFFLIKKTERSYSMVCEWLDYMLYFPSIVTDEFENERSQQIAGFSQHRNDQSILSILIRYYETKNNILILNEEFETTIKNQSVRTLRIIDFKPYCNKTFKKTFKKILKTILKKCRLLC
jgi:hypothetical protein